jgi:predicted cupin superfamily sugar epimerase
MITADEIIRHFNLKLLPDEGGYYTETYRSKEIINKSGLPERYKTDKQFCTAIIYLITTDTFSALHKLTTDEIFHFYAGDPVDMLQLFPDNTAKIITLGSDFLQGQEIQCVVPAGVWQGSILKEGGKWALLGTTVSPGFDFDDFQLGSRNELISKYPSQRDFILRLTNCE